MDQRQNKVTRYLTGVQSSGRPHLGNILGAIQPALALGQQPGKEAYFFIADLHSLTTIKEADVRRENTLAVAAAWLACGLDPERSLLYRQSDLPEVCELTWYLSCFTPFPMLANAHSFKDKSDRLSDVNAGLFTYPVLMAADILLYDAHIVPVGKDQRQHLEITRDIATAFNRQYGTEEAPIFVVPEAEIREDVMVIPGTDGQKMSKSYGNTLDIFSDDKSLLKQVKSIKTDSTPLEEPKNPESDTVFQLYKLVASQEQVAEMATNYRKGGYGYGHAKQALYDALVTKFAKERERYNYYIAHPAQLEEILQDGATKAQKAGKTVLQKVRKVLGF